MKRLDFVCVGPQRTATSWLDKALRAHPEVALPASVKETFFFDRRFGKGVDWYLGKFFPAKYRAGKICGEIAPTLFDHPLAIERLHQHNDSFKVIILVRDPVVRALSLFQHFVTTARVPNCFDEAVRLRPSIVEASEYTRIVSHWTEKFGKHRVFLLSTSFILKSPEFALGELTKFLGVSSFDELPIEVKHKYGVSASPRSRLLLVVFHRAAYVLRLLGFNSFVNLLRDLGIKRFISSGGVRLPVAITAESKEKLVVRFSGEMTFVEWVDKVGCAVAGECPYIVERLSKE